MSQRTMGIFQPSFPPGSNLHLHHWFVDCTNISVNNQCVFTFFPYLIVTD